MQADIYKAPIVLTNSTEGAAYGVAILAGVGTGVWSSVEEACQAAIKQTAKIAPKAKASEFYDRQFATYEKLYPAVKGLFPEMGCA